MYDWIFSFNLLENQLKRLRTCLNIPALLVNALVDYIMTSNEYLQFVVVVECRYKLCFVCLDQNAT